LRCYLIPPCVLFFFFSSRRRHTRSKRDWSSDVCSSDLTSDLPPLRYAATTLVLVNKLDQVPAGEREAAVETVRDRVHQRNPRVIVIGTHHARLDPALIFDPGAGERDHRRRGAGEPD